MKKIQILTILCFSVILLVTSCKSGSSSKDIVTLTSSNFADETAKGVVLVDFWATWCVPCRAMAPVVDEIASQTKGKLKVGKVDIDANGTIANKFSINAIPTVIIFKDGQVMETLVGVQSKAALVNALSKYVDLQ